jgi:predicted RNA-binding Zn-ribbon protein involved in translation (DUF1610 family)
MSLVIDVEIRISPDEIKELKDTQSFHDCLEQKIDRGLLFNPKCTVLGIDDYSNVILRVEAMIYHPKNPMKRYWECTCCGSLMVTNPQDYASKYVCPQCRIVKCKDPGQYEEITQNAFCKKAAIPIG